jgi:triacylglycerol lipase
VVERPPSRELWREAGTYREYRRLRSSPVFAGEGVERGDGQPVLLVPGFLTGDNALGVMARWLRRTGHRPARAGIGVNLACGERATQALERRLDDVARRTGRKVAIVGHSRGGHFARVLAVRRPDLVSGIVTLGAPPMDPLAIHPLVRISAIAVTSLGSLGVPNLLRFSCFLGSCCRQFREQLQGPFPREVGFVAVYSRHDPIVDWRRLTERAADEVEVRATHTGIVVCADAYRAVAAALRSFPER